MEAHTSGSSLNTILQRRGFVVADRNDLSQVLCPDDVAPMLEFQQLFGKKSTRKLLRSALRMRRQHRDELARVAGTGSQTISERIDTLARLRVLNIDADGFVTATKAVDNIGPTLEWYVARTIEDEMAGQAGWAVKLRGITVGGDFDVLAWIDVLVHVETKARRPEDISNDELLNFLQRGEELSPEIQVLLIDTDDDLQPFVDRMVRQAMVAPIRHANPGLPASFPEADHMFVKLDAPYEGLYRWGRRVYVSNTQVGVAEALRRCVRHYNRIGRHLLIPTSETPMNWVPVPKSPDPDGMVD